MRRQPRSRVPLWIALLCVVCVAAPTLARPARAQTGPGDRVAEELRATDDVLDRARALVAETDSQRARDLLETAASIQGNAWSQYQRRGYALARKLTAEARQIAARAVTLAREDFSMRDRALREGEKAERAFAQAQGQAGDGAEPQAVRLLQQAGALIEQGRVKFGEQRYHAALRLAISAQRLIRQAMGLMGEGPVDGTPRLVRELERTDHLIERTRPLVEQSGNPDAMRLLSQGQDLQARAWEAYRSDRLRAAAAGTREARNMVSRARALGRGPLDRSAVESALAETERLLDHAAGVVADSGHEQATTILDRAFGHQEKARRFLHNGQLRKALAETRVARSLAKRAVRVADQDDAR